MKAVMLRPTQEERLINSLILYSPWHISQRSGNWNNEGNCRVFYLNVNNDSSNSNANIGSQQIERSIDSINLVCITAVPLGKKGASTEFSKLIEI